jgi:hypothetical protein
MRPGSVIGEQQHYLCAASADERPPAPRPRGASAPRRCEALAAQVAAGVERRGLLRARGGCAASLPCAAGSAARPESARDRPAGPDAAVEQ